jgi:hypothetical protein
MLELKGARVLKKHDAPLPLRPGNTVVDPYLTNKLNKPVASSHLSAQRICLVGHW